jgi:hypothetical protein
MTTNNTLHQIKEALRPLNLLGWLETLPEEEVHPGESLDLLLKYLQQRNLSDFTLEHSQLILSAAGVTQEIQYQRWLRWFLLDYDEAPPPLPTWKVRYLLFKAVADDLRVRHESPSS